MIDIHHHCLPGVDDGPEALEAAVAQCRAAFEDGIRTVVATPHRRHPQFDVAPERAREAHGRLEAALADAGVGLRLLLGHEAHYSEGLAAGLRDGEVLTLGGNGRWFLFELPASHLPAHLDRMIFDLQIAGFYPVLAHPERNAELAGKTEKLEHLRRHGVRVQLTAMSLTGEFGKRPLQASERWVREGLVDFLATDAHDTERRPPRLREATERASQLAGREAALRMVEENPGRLLRGEDLE